MMEMNSDAAERVEALAEELSARLWEAAQKYQPSSREKYQDWLMEQMSRDSVLKTRLLRFIDVIAALDFDHRGILVKRLFREYFSGNFPLSSWLLRALFSFCRQPFMPARLVSSISRSAMLALADRFIAGPDIQSILDTIADLEKRGRYPTFALLGEDVLSDYEAELFKDRYLEVIDRLAEHPWSKKSTAAGAPALQLSIKLTSLTDNFNPADPEGTLNRVKGRLEEIVQHCSSCRVGLTLDAEHFEYRELTWYLFWKIFGPESSLGQWDGAGLTVQSYYKDSEEFLGTVLDFASQRQAPFQIRLVKGAYWDYEVITARHNRWPVPVFEQKGETDRAFQRMLGMLVEHNRNVTVAVASHNIRDHAYVESLRDSRGLPEGVIEHQVLFGAAEGISRALRRLGWETRDYVPSGRLVPGMPFLVRRVLELTDPVGFLRRRRAKDSASELLRPPDTGNESNIVERTVACTFDFHNNPPKQLFLANERKTFESAMKASRSQWGQEYPIELAGQPVRTQEVKASLSPSRPDSNHPVGLVRMAGVEEAEKAVSIAQQGFARWSATPAEERARVLTRAAELLSKERDNLAAWIVHEGGRTWGEALADVDESVDHLAYNASRLRALQDTVREQYQPRGVVVVISPWNFPTALPAGMLSGALAAGNTVILKSAEQTPIIAARLVAVLHAGGIPEDALLHLPGRGEVVGPYLVGSPGVNMVAFTGSKAVGLAIVRNAPSVPIAPAVKKVIAEMGGKNAIIVFPDADLDEAVRGILLSAFEHANQKCSACSRVFVHKAVIGRVRERLIRAAASLPVGPADDPSTLVNPLIEMEARERVLSYVRKAQKEGKVLIDRIEQGTANPLQVGPMVVELDPADLSRATIAQEEIFGPVLVLVPFEDEEKMLAEVNGTVYGLTAGVFSRSPATVARMTRGIHAGNIYVNRKITGARVGIEPFGGFKLSGTGPKAGSPDYLLAFMTRITGYQPTQTSPNTVTEVSQTYLADRVEPWLARAVQRRDVLRWSINLLRREFRSDMLQALSEAYRISTLEAEKLAKQLIEIASKVVESVGEIAEMEATILLPGQKNYINWETPRGRGFVVTDDNTPADRFAGMVYGPLLAGNGLALAPPSKLRAVSKVLVCCLHRAGVPRSALVEAPSRGTEAAISLASEMFHFAVTDMPLEETRRVCERLGETREAEGQKWVKALISMPEGPQPGEPGFVRLFAIPKTIAIRTLRHGADLELPQVNARTEQYENTTDKLPSGIFSTLLST
ncbi:MAG: proline dehydrogenase family protein [Chloroflexi bacterium]|nr:proline dehydrogenase family protein [Chloroflexota bacterium]